MNALSHQFTLDVSNPWEDYLPRLELFEKEYSDSTQQVLVNAVVDHYVLSLKSSNRARERLAVTIGAFSDPFIDIFKVGYSDRTVGKRLPDSDSFDGLFSRNRLQRIGVFKSSGHERFRGGFIFPLYDIDGNIVGIFGYWSYLNIKHLKERFVVWNEDDVGIFNPSALMSSRELIVCRTPVDASFLWNLGFNNVVSIKGYNSNKVLMTQVVSLSQSPKIRLFENAWNSGRWIEDSKRAIKQRGKKVSVGNLSDFIKLC